MTPMALPAGETRVYADKAGMIALPVTITIRESIAPEGVDRETLFYRVIAHELGHALGLPHVRDPRSLMCCAQGVRADPRALRQPDVRSVRRQLGEQYFRLWSDGSP